MTPAAFVSLITSPPPPRVFRFAGTLDELRAVLNAAGLGPRCDLPSEMQRDTKMPYWINGWLFDATPVPGQGPGVWIARTLDEVMDAQAGRIAAEPIEATPGA